MKQPPITPEKRFATVIEELLGHPDVVPPSDGKEFGSSGLKIKNKIFAMLVRGQLVVKLPKQRVDALVSSGDGERFTANRGRPMQEWITIDPISEKDWLQLSREAMEFVGSKS